MEYLIKSSALIIAFYVCYKVLLQRDTFFETKRWYFLTGILFAIVLPLVVIPIYITKEPINTSFIIEQTTRATTTHQVSTPFNWTLLLSTIYIIGVGVFSIRMVIQLFSLASLIFRNEKHRVGKFIYVKVNDTISPFSFFNWIVFNPSQFKDDELNHIITHEKIHATQYHSIDLLLTQIATVLFWCNPFIWLYKKALEQNLEFIADDETQKHTSCEKSYQQLLLKTSVPNYQMAFANNFYNSLIKKRITMLHTSKSHKKSQWKILAILPLLALFLISFSTKEIYAKAPSTTNLESSYKGDVTTLIISKNMSDDELDNTVKEFKKSGVVLKFSNLKRNSNGAITKISISASSKNSKAKFEAHSDKPISAIIITYNSEDDSISIGNTSPSVSSFTYEIKDGKHRVKKTEKGNNVFVHSSHSDDADSHEIIEDDDKIIIKTDGKIKTIKKSSENTFHIISDDEGELHEETIEIKKTSKKGMHIAFGENENPLILLDGKEITKQEMEALDTDTVKTIEVIKDDNNVKKYGEKAKDGVVIITSKDK